MKKRNHAATAISIVFLAISFNASAGPKSSDAYFVKVDSETTTQASQPAGGSATGKRQHKPFTAIKPLDKASPLIAPGMRKYSNVTLKRGVID